MLQIIVTIAIIGLIVWAVTYFIPMPPKFQTLICVVAGVGLLIYLLQVVGGLPALPRCH